MTLQQLTERERCQIEVPNTEGYTQTKIATALGSSPSTICRGLACNSEAKSYRGSRAIQRTDQRRREAKKSEKLAPVMRRMTRNLQADAFRPQHICGRLKLELEAEITLRPSIVTFGPTEEW